MSKPPHGWTGCLSTTVECPLRGDPMGAPVDASHSRTVLSTLPLASCVPSGLHETDTTLLPCPLRVDKHDPEVMSHVLMVLSEEPLTRMLGLSGLKATHLTQLLLKYTKLVLTKNRKHSLEGEGAYLCPLRVDNNKSD